MLRNSEFVRGLEDIRHAGDRTKVSEGNDMMRFAAQVIHTVFASNSGGAIENPWSSWIWQARPFRALVTHHRCHLARTDFCMSGTPWQKGTGICTNSNPATLPIWSDAAQVSSAAFAPELCSRTLSYEALFLMGDFRPPWRSLVPALCAPLLHAWLTIVSPALPARSGIIMPSFKCKLC